MKSVANTQEAVVRDRSEMTDGELLQCLDFVVSDDVKDADEIKVFQHEDGDICIFLDERYCWSGPLRVWKEYLPGKEAVDSETVDGPHRSILARAWADAYMERKYVRATQERLDEARKQRDEANDRFQKVFPQDEQYSQAYLDVFLADNYMYDLQKAFERARKNVDAVEARRAQIVSLIKGEFELWTDEGVQEFDARMRRKAEGDDSKIT